MVDTGEVRVTSSTGGQKGSKPQRFDLIPTGPLTMLAEHYGKGADKYEQVNGRDNWRNGYEWSLSYAAMMRHLNAFWSGEDIDPETGSPHMVAVAWHAFTLLDFLTHYPELDDRQDPLYAREADCKCEGVAEDGTVLTHVGLSHAEQRERMAENIRSEREWLGFPVLEPAQTEVSRVARMVLNEDERPYRRPSMVDRKGSSGIGGKWVRKQEAHLREQARRG